MKKLNNRQRNILNRVRKVGYLKVSEIQKQFSISQATVYRDIHLLKISGLVEQTLGGIRLPQVRTQNTIDNCIYCRKTVNDRTAFRIQSINGEISVACCSHCGLLALELNPTVNIAALTPDYLYGSMVNVRQAHYLIESRVSLCCTPSVLSFAKKTDAEDFRLGFGGRIFSYKEGIEHLTQLMSLQRGVQE